MLALTSHWPHASALYQQHTDPLISLLPSFLFVPVRLPLFASAIPHDLVANAYWVSSLVADNLVADKPIFGGWQFGG
jgi:hypothetical protein